ncbi:U6 snRNA (guanine-N(2))-methyltransferase THUMPD2 [Microcaecilia unicolor]|uniref:U6 snRNA (guanine-N(2))-methyltransferase THUMPD2 n=1 Tax=Microcaecilia unicolor TaxID=1415580 RepID=A0A6P7XH29_9AMPH|nr:THUMP domain-containing protein 2 [Microcaecilia unicolor]
MVPAAPARYFCTSGKGMEHFVAQEVKNKLAAEKVEHVSGKVFFTTNSDLRKLQTLKSAERLFLLLKKLPPLSLPENKGRGLYKIKQYVIGDPCCWLDALSVWQNLQGKGFKEENPLFLKRNAEHAQTSLAPKKRKEDTTYVEAEDYHLENQIVSPLLVGREDDGKNNKQTFPGVPAQNQKEKPIADIKQHCISFRVSCRCSGTVAKRFTAQEVGRIVGIGLIKEFGWKADLRNPYLEIFVHLNDSYCVVGFPVLRHPLASREYIQRPGLRSTVAWAMASLAEINSGAFVLDPMCGFGTILMEAAKEWPDVQYLGVDVNASQLQGAYENVKTAKLQDKINLFKASALELPLRSGSVDVVISDIPFGKKFKAAKDMKLLLPDILQEMERVLHVGGTLVLLLSRDLYNHINRHGIRIRSNENLSCGNEMSRPEMKAGSYQEKTNRSPTAVSSVMEEMAQETFASKMTHCGSLMPVEFHGVSLGVTDAFIYKCKKISSAVL